MRILLIGGTRFVGRAMAEAALARGHEVTLLHRRPTDDPAFAGAEHLLADRDGDLSILAGRVFDATIDVCAYVPRQVIAVADALVGRGGRHIFISTMSVYAETQAYGFDESGPLAELDDPTTEDVTNETYGGLKVLCERAAESAYGTDNLAIVRPTYVVGPYDGTGRFTWWVRRIAAGGEVLAPGPRDAPMQVIDARDQGAWTVLLAETRATGPFNSVAPPMPYGFGDMLDEIVRSVGPEGTRLSWVEGRWLEEQGETGMSLPLWTEARADHTMAADVHRATETGLTARSVADTAADTLTWMRRTDAPLVEGWGLPAEREAELLAAWAASGRVRGT
jgi:nucleoside-diphosphate-sugar epimerase